MQILLPDWHDSLTSTNSVLADRINGGESVPIGYVLAAREQTAGRGRYERQWVATPGENLTFSLLLPADLPLERLASAPMAAALGVVSFLSELGLKPQTKWPNDVLVGGRKICGILAESAKDVLIIGIGLNVNMSASAIAEIDRPATSLLVETGASQEVEALLPQLLSHLSPWLGRWQVAGFSALSAAWCQHCPALGTRIAVGEGGSTQDGVLEGFGQHGQLLLRCDGGALAEIWAGDVNPPVS